MNTLSVRPSHAAWRRGFTLIELLTVIAIIGILAAIIIPVVGKVRTTAKRAQGLNNLRQIMMASITYTQDNRGRWFQSSNESGNRMYTEVLSDYIAKVTDAPRSELFFDPLLPNTGHLHFAALGIYFADIAGNASLKPYNNFNNIKAPAKTVLFADSWNDKNVPKSDPQVYPGAQPYIMNVGAYNVWGYPGQYGSYTPNTTDGRRLPPATYGNAGGEIDLSRDPGRAKLGFLDGHVTTVKREEMFHRLFDPRYN